jgi:hypothetical protein
MKETDFIPIDELLKIWIRVHKEVRARERASARDIDLSWWAEAFEVLRPPPPSEDSDRTIGEG